MRTVGASAPGPVQRLAMVALRAGIGACALLLAACAATSGGAPAGDEPFDWRADWAVPDGFSIAVDTEGYQLPTAIAFVPDPGDGPKDPLYFVTEVRGTIKVVTNDRTVLTFAENLVRTEPQEELPSGKGQTGLAGICLDPAHGYVFATFAYRDPGGILRNNVVRFESAPRTFSTSPAGQTDFREIFLGQESGLAHQIGPCQVDGDTLFVSVGEAWRPTEAQKIDVMAGKIIRMTLDGRPVPDNPFYRDGDVHQAANYVWAYGLRNPFGLKLVDHRLFVADNGNDIDRFLEVRAGENYFWNGNDWSIATNAAFVFVPSLAPVQLDLYPRGSDLFPERYRQSFFVALAGVTERDKLPGVAALDYDFERDRLRGVPGYFLEYRGRAPQIVSGLAFGPDGLYVAPILPNAEGRSAILKITYDPANAHPYTLDDLADGKTLMREKGCLGCHELDGDWGFGGTAGPPLDTRGEMVARIQARLDSETYRRGLQEVERLDEEPYRSYAGARAEVLAARGLERVRLWMKYHIIEPRFDNPYAQMPNLGLTDAEARAITDFLMQGATADGVGRVEPVETLLRRLLPPRPGRKHLLAFFVGGFLLGGLSLGSSWAALRGLRRRAGPSAAEATYSSTECEGSER